MPLCGPETIRIAFKVYADRLFERSPFGTTQTPKTRGLRQPTTTIPTRRFGERSALLRCQLRAMATVAQAPAEATSTFRNCMRVCPSF